jgi:hypothetical protein
MADDLLGQAIGGEPGLPDVVAVRRVTPHLLHRLLDREDPVVVCRSEPEQGPSEHVGGERVGVVAGRVHVADREVRCQQLVGDLPDAVLVILDRGRREMRVEDPPVVAMCFAVLVERWRRRPCRVAR